MCVCVLLEGRGSLILGMPAISLLEHVDRRASLKQTWGRRRYGEGQGGSVSSRGDPELEEHPLEPSSQLQHNSAGTHPTRSAHDFFFFSFSACSQWGGEASDLHRSKQALTPQCQSPQKYTHCPKGFSQSSGGSDPDQAKMILLERAAFPRGTMQPKKGKESAKGTELQLS